MSGEYVYFKCAAVRLRESFCLKCGWQPPILANFMLTLALPEAVKQWSLTSLREKPVKIGAKVVRHGRYVIFQMAEVAVPRELFQEILRLIDGLRPRPAPA